MLLVEQNAAMALELADHAYLIETGRVVLSGTADELKRNDAVRRVLPGLLMEALPAPGPRGPRHRRHLRQPGARAGDDLPGDAPGELRAGRDGDVLDLHRLEPDQRRHAVLVGVLADGRRSPSLLGVLIERIVIRPVENAPVLAVVVVFIGLLVIFNSVAGWIYTYTIKSFPSPFPEEPPFGSASCRRTSSARSASRWWCWRCSTPSSASRRSAWRCAPRRRTRCRAAWSASASAGCWRSAGASPRRSARSPA